MRYFDYLLKHVSQLEGASPREVMRMARGIFRTSRRVCFTIRPLSPHELPRKQVPAIEVGAAGVVGGARVG